MSVSIANEVEKHFEFSFIEDGDDITIFCDGFIVAQIDQHGRLVVCEGQAGEFTELPVDDDGNWEVLYE
jgi:hypothetical protein